MPPPPLYFLFAAYLPPEYCDAGAATAYMQTILVKIRHFETKSFLDKGRYIPIPCYPISVMMNVQTKLRTKSIVTLTNEQIINGPKGHELTEAICPRA